MIVVGVTEKMEGMEEYAKPQELLVLVCQRLLAILSASLDSVNGPADFVYELGQYFF